MPIARGPWCARMVRFIEHDEIVADGRQRSSTQRFIGAEGQPHVRPCRRARPHGAKGRWRDDERFMRRGGDRQRDVGLAESYVVGEERTAVLVERRLYADDRLALVRLERDVT